MGERQALIDAFYWQYGKSCAGCDHWQNHNSLVGECTKSAPVPGRDRDAMIGIESCSLHIGAGHPFTPRDHVCGDFADTFDWGTLPESYRAQIGCRLPHTER
ncbi:hypothetical protein [Stakelama pacifica]|uniref:Uncharacterized protein n=1 Tax=Stakelama pacifica TaxID=517720 RepID=A0A4R6FC11_9SPHN|nr:hypothetical protein [Stakelama pacifica]TDN77745.1 hypothetical protein EV664_1268 [Stakelama pacifica]GGP00877.1 hypothetical protein GCM10011329_37770 [Stakelama pacifica]